jgi:hypothetical protein
MAQWKKGCCGVCRAYEEMEQSRVDRFNAENPIGTPVRYWPGERRGEGVLSQTRSQAAIQSDHGSVWVEGMAGSVALTHVEVLPRQAGELPEGEDR